MKLNILRKLKKQAKEEYLLKMRQKKLIEEDSIISVAEEWKAFVNDPRYAGIKELLTSYIKVTQPAINELPYSNKSDEQIRKEYYIFSGEIKAINRILNTPNEFIEEYNKIIKKREKQRKSDG